MSLPPFIQTYSRDTREKRSHVFLFGRHITVPSIALLWNPQNLVRGVGAERGVILRAAQSRGGTAGAGSAALTKVLLAEGRQALLLGDGVDVGADYEGHKVEEGQPCVLGQELLGKGQAERRGDPAHLHHLPEANLDRGLYLVEVLGTRDQGHGDEVDGVLNGGNLEEATVVSTSWTDST